MARPSRALRPSATTTRYAGCLCAPMRVNRMRTAMGAVCLLWTGGAAPGLGCPATALLDGDDEARRVDLGPDAAGGDDRVERREERLDRLVVLGPVDAGDRRHHALDEAADRGDVDEGHAGVLVTDP